MEALSARAYARVPKTLNLRGVQSAHSLSPSDTNREPAIEIREQKAGNSPKTEEGNRKMQVDGKLR